MPAILGLSRALKGSAKSRAAAFREMCSIEEEEKEEGEEGQRELDLQGDDVVKMKNMVIIFIRSTPPEEGSIMNYASFVPSSPPPDPCRCSN